MQVILTSPKGKRYMCKPFGNGLCWELFTENKNFGKPKKTGKIDNQEWKSLEVYPCDLPYALHCMVENMMLDPNEDVSIKTGKGAIDKQIEGVRKCIDSYVKKISMEVKNG